MPRAHKPNSNVKAVADSAPAAEMQDSAPVAAPVEVKKKPVELVSYFRVKKISNYLYQILEVEVDESVNPPKLTGKTDMRELVMDKLYDLACPHPDLIRKKK